MRINYYCFPDEVDPHTRYLNGCEAFAGEGDKETGGCTEADYELSGISVTTAGLNIIHIYNHN